DYASHRELHTFPTRRSSDLGGAGLNGHIQMENLAATLPDVPPVRAEKVTASISDGRIRFNPARLETANGVLTAAGDLHLSERQADRKSTRLNSSHRTISYAV